MFHLDLSNRNLTLSNDSGQELKQSLRGALDDPALGLKQVTHLYLNNNRINSISLSDLMEIFPNLVWLDLRYNRIKTIDTSSSITLDKCLEIQMQRFSPPDSGHDSDDEGSTLSDSSKCSSSKKGMGDGEFPANRSPAVRANHLRTVLLQNNRLTAWPQILSCEVAFPLLKVVQCADNPFTKDVTAGGTCGEEENRVESSNEDSGVVSQEENSEGRCSRSNCRDRCHNRQDTNHVLTGHRSNFEKLMRRRSSTAKAKQPAVQFCMCQGNDKKILNIRKKCHVKSHKSRPIHQLEILFWECSGPQAELVQAKADQLNQIKKRQRNQNILNKKLQKSKDEAVLKSWRKRYGRFSQETFREICKTPKELRPGAATYTLSNAPLGLERDRRMQQNHEIQFDAKPGSEHDTAVNALVAEIDRVLARRPCWSHAHDDHGTPDVANAKETIKEIVNSSNEVKRVAGEIKKSRTKLHLGK